MPPVLQTPSHAHRFAEPASAEEWARLIGREATTWTYIIRNRRRWIDTSEGVESQRVRAIDTLMRLGLSEEALEALRQEAVVEVIIPYTSESEGWETRIFPWEHVLASATASGRSRDGLTVLRRLDKPGWKPAVVNPARVLYVESTPG